MMIYNTTVEGYGQPFPLEWVQELAAEGAIAQIAWEPNEGLQQVQDDDYLRQFARLYQGHWDIRFQ